MWRTQGPTLVKALMVCERQASSSSTGSVCRLTMQCSTQRMVWYCPCGHSHYYRWLNETKGMSFTSRIKSDLTQIPAINLEQAALPCLVGKRGPSSPSTIKMDRGEGGITSPRGCSQLPSKVNLLPYLLSPVVSLTFNH